jgi:hypothetical protein
VGFGKRETDFLLICAVHSRAVLDQQPRVFNEAFSSGVVKGGRPLVVVEVHVRASVDEQLTCRAIGAIEQWSAPLKTYPVNFCSGINQKLDHVKLV